LLELIYNQDRGRLNYPNEKFVTLIIQGVSEIGVLILTSRKTHHAEQFFSIAF
jgi:hypothetical protein